MKSTTLIIALVAVTWLFDLARAEIEFEKIGNPSWEPADAFISAVDFPHSQDFSEQFDVDAIEFLSGALGESYFAADDELYVLFPTDSAAASETQPFRGAIARAGGFDSDVFLASDMTNTDRIFRSLTIVPRSEDGQQNDMRSIPNDVFPIISTWQHEWVNGRDIIETCQLCEPVVIESLEAYGTTVNENGESQDYANQEWSEIPTWWTMAWSGSPSSSEISGDYEAVIEFRDANDDGWDVTYYYSVVPRRTRVDGDLNYDNTLDVDDLNVVSQNLALGATNPRLDLNDDEEVDTTDLGYMVSDLMNTWIGDANLDGEFNSGDFVAVFQAGKYETDQLALWSEGDWNADQRFDSGDFVVAFQGGGFEAGPRTAVSVVPEPSGWLLAVLGIAAIRLRKSS